MSREFFRMTAKNRVGRVDIYGAIGFYGTSASSFARQWKEVEAQSDRIELHVASNGGNPFDALTIYNIVQQSKVPVDVYIDGLAASSASIIVMSGRKTYMAKNALLMLHNASTDTYGDRREHEKSIAVLDAVTDAITLTYIKKSGKTKEEIFALLDAETWYGADQAKSEGFVDEVVDAVPLAAKFDIDACAFTVPDAYRDRFEMKAPESPANGKEITMSDTPKPEAPKPATIQEIKAACEGCGNDFVVAQIEAQSTLPQVQAAWTKELAAQLKAERDAKTAIEAKNAELLAAQIVEPTGVQPIGPKGGKIEAKIEGDPIALWDQAVLDATKNGATKAQAILAAAKAQPELHKAYIQAYNQNYAA